MFDYCIQIEKQLIFYFRSSKEKNNAGLFHIIKQNGYTGIVYFNKNQLAQKIGNTFGRIQLVFIRIRENFIFCQSLIKLIDCKIYINHTLLLVLETEICNNILNKPKNQEEMDTKDLVEAENKRRRKQPHLDIVEGDEGWDTMNSFAKCQKHLGDCCGCCRTWVPCIFCMCVEYPYQQVQQSSVGLITRFGKYVNKTPPGLIYINPCTDKLISVDMRL